MKIILILMCIYCFVSGMDILLLEKNSCQKEKFGYDIMNETQSYYVIVCNEYTSFLTSENISIEGILCRIDSYTSEDVFYNISHAKECCTGYLEYQQKCEPICENNCIHGNCIAPNICLCSAGWIDSTCNSTCAHGYWGQNCNKTCSCENVTICNPENGECSRNEDLSFRIKRKIIENIPAISSILSIFIIILALKFYFKKTKVELIKLLRKIFKSSSKNVKIADSEFKTQNNGKTSEA